MTGKQVPAPSFHPEMWAALLEGRKCCTTRREKIGDPGDWFEIEASAKDLHARYRIVDVQKKPFGQIQELYYRLEGFNEPGGFGMFWIRIHRGHLPHYQDERWLHFLARIADGVQP